MNKILATVAASVCFSLINDTKAQTLKNIEAVSLNAGMGDQKSRRYKNRCLC